MTCLICTHKDAATLLAALPHTPLRRLQATYGVSRSVLSRHRVRGCPDSAPRPPQAASGEMARVIALLTEIRELLTVLAHRPQDTVRAAVHQEEPVNWNRL